jgi:hypothetical protein
LTFDPHIRAACAYRKKYTQKSGHFFHICDDKWSQTHPDSLFALEAHAPASPTVSQNLSLFPNDIQ